METEGPLLINEDSRAVMLDPTHSAEGKAEPLQPQESPEIESESTILGCVIRLYIVTITSTIGAYYGSGSRVVTAIHAEDVTTFSVIVKTLLFFIGPPFFNLCFAAWGLISEENLWPNKAGNQKDVGGELGPKPPNMGRLKCRLIKQGSVVITTVATAIFFCGKSYESWCIAMEEDVLAVTSYIICCVHIFDTLMSLLGARLIYNRMVETTQQLFPELVLKSPEELFDDTEYESELSERPTGMWIYTLMNQGIWTTKDWSSTSMPKNCLELIIISIFSAISVYHGSFFALLRPEAPRSGFMPFLALMKAGLICVGLPFANVFWMALRTSSLPCFSPLPFFSSTSDIAVRYVISGQTFKVPSRNQLKCQMIEVISSMIAALVATFLGGRLFYDLFLVSREAIDPSSLEPWDIFLSNFVGIQLIILLLFTSSMLRWLPSLCKVLWKTYNQIYPEKQHRGRLADCGKCIAKMERKAKQNIATAFGFLFILRWATCQSYSEGGLILSAVWILATGYNFLVIRDVWSACFRVCHEDKGREMCSLTWCDGRPARTRLLELISTFSKSMLSFSCFIIYIVNMEKLFTGHDLDLQFISNFSDAAIIITLVLVDTPMLLIATGLIILNIRFRLGTAEECGSPGWSQPEKKGMDIDVEKGCDRVSGLNLGEHTAY